MKETTLANRIKAIRKQMGLTQLQFAYLLGYKNYIAVARLEKGTRNPSVKHVALIAAKSGRTLDWIITGNSETFTISRIAPSIHHLKTIAPYFQDVLDGVKTFECRKNDRDFKVGDYLVLKEFIAGEFTGREVKKAITYKLDGNRMFGVFYNYCVLGLSS